MKNINKQIGAVSLFVVIFATLLITVVTVSFVRIMVQSQQQASSTDLSQSAFDSAQAGVEDAKRALLRVQKICDDNGLTSQACIDARHSIDSPDLVCNDAVRTLTDINTISPIGSGKEVKVTTNDDANDLDQAYTCVKISTLTDDYAGTLVQDTNKFIPLVGTSNFDRIRIDWFTSSNLGDSNSPINIPNPTSAPSSPKLLSQNSWTTQAVQNRPSILRAQLIQFSSTDFSLTDFEGVGTKGYNNALFLYPSTINEASNFLSNGRKTANRGPVQTICENLGSTRNYSCSATIILPSTVSNNDHVQYLNLSSIYKTTDFRVTLWNGAEPSSTLVKFDNVQPEIDSTGRANDLYRRVRSRVEITNINFPYPVAEVDITGSLCKDFKITDRVEDYDNPLINAVSADGKTINGCTP